jgi:putative transposase
LDYESPAEQLAAPDRRQLNPKRVQRLVRKMGFASIAPKPGTSRPAPGDEV